MKNFKITALSQIKKHPEIRITFYKADYMDFLDLCKLSKSLKTNITALTRCLIKSKIKERKNFFLSQNFVQTHSWDTEIIQGLHNIEQQDIFAAEQHIKAENIISESKLNDSVMIKKPNRIKGKSPIKRPKNRGFFILKSL